MRQLILTAFIWVLAIPSFAQIVSTPTQTVGSTGVTCSSACTVTISAPAAHHNLYVLSTSGTNTIHLTSITGGGVTWGGSATIASAVNRSVEIWEGVNSSGSGTSIVLTYSSSVNPAWFIVEWDLGGTTAASTKDTTGNANGTNTVISATLSPNPTASTNELMLYVQRAGGAFSAGPTLGTRVTQGSVNGAALGAYNVVSSTSGSYTQGFTTTASGTYDAVYASFKAPASSNAAFQVGGFLVGP